MSALDVSSVPGSGALAAARTLLQPDPTVPLSAGVGPASASLLAWMGVDHGVSGRLVSLAGSRLSVTVTDRGIRTRGLVTSDFVAWEDASSVELMPLSAVLVHDVADVLLGRLPVTRGLRWGAERLVGDLPDRAAEVVSDHITGDPLILRAVRAGGRGDDVVIDGTLALAAVVSASVTDAARQMAERHGVPVRTIRSSSRS